MPQSVTLPVAEWLPDMTHFPPTGAGLIKNVQPRTPLSYGALGAPMPISSALDARCQGAAAYLGNTGTVNLFAGDAGKLYRLVAGNAYQWVNVSRAAGYNVTIDEYWEFEHFNGAILACNYADPIQTFDLASGATFTDLGGSPPRAKHIAVVKNSFVMLGYTFDPIGQDQSQRVWWSAAGDASSWPTPGGQLAAQLQSGFFDLFGQDGPVQAIRGGVTSADAIVFQQYGIRRVVYAGPPQVFEFLPAQNARGTPAPYSPVVVGGNCYFYGYDGWYVTDGASSEPIGVNKIDRTFDADLDTTQTHRIVGAADPRSKMIWWAYPSRSGGGALDRLLGYNWQLQRWTMAEMTIEFLSRMDGLGYTLDELWTILGYTLDNLPAPLDSPVWAGGALQLGVFGADHKLSYLTGSPLPATVETSENQAIPGRRVGVISARPLIDGSGTGAPSVAIGRRERQQDAVRYTGATALGQLGICPQRTSGRYLRAQMTVGSGGDWANISGVELEIVPQGKR